MSPLNERRAEHLRVLAHLSTAAGALEQDERAAVAWAIAELAPTIPSPLDATGRTEAVLDFERECRFIAHVLRQLEHHELVSVLAGIVRVQHACEEAMRDGAKENGR